VKPIYFLGIFLFILSASLCAQTADTTRYPKDSLKKQLVADTLKGLDSSKITVAKKNGVTLKNKLLNTDGEPLSLAVLAKKVKSNDFFFYLIALMVLLLAFLKFFFGRYLQTCSGCFLILR
jgi:hypothetical protein